MHAELSELFPTAPGRSLPYRALRRHGRLQLALPSGPAAADTLELYAAQRPAARLLKRGLQWLARLHLPLPLPKGSLVLPDGDGFAAYLQRLAPAAPGHFLLGICAGNPNAPGRRWLLAVFAGRRPMAVVKAGATPLARTLIEHECAVRLPAATSTFADERISAFSMPFILGRMPSLRDWPALQTLLISWLEPDTLVPLRELPPWDRLLACELPPLFHARVVQIGDLSVAPTRLHGDFAPWNIRLQPDGPPVVLDWERGLPRGVPLWDALHFILQPLLLVQRRPVPQMIEELEHQLSTVISPDYLRRANLAGHERELAWAYVLYCCRVQRQTEGAEALEALLSALTTRWSAA